MRCGRQGGKWTALTLSVEWSCGWTRLSIQTSPVNHSAGPFAVGGFGLISVTSSSRRQLLVTGDQAHSRYFSDNVHDQTKHFSDLVVVPGVRHIDLYDRIDLIPFDALQEFFLAELDATKES